MAPVPPVMTTCLFEKAATEGPYHPDAAAGKMCGCGSGSGKVAP